MEAIGDDESDYEVDFANQPVKGSLGEPTPSAISLLCSLLYLLISLTSISDGKESKGQESGGGDLKGQMTQQVTSFVSWKSQFSLLPSMRHLFTNWRFRLCSILRCGKKEKSAQRKPSTCMRISIFSDLTLMLSLMKLEAGVLNGPR